MSKMPAPASTQPTVMGIRGPARATQGPVRTEATIKPAAIGMKSSAVWYAEAFATTCR